MAAETKTIKEPLAENETRRALAEAEKLAEEARRESETRFQVAQELSLDGFTLLEAVRGDDDQLVDFRWTYINPQASRMLRQPPEALIGHLLLETLPGNQAGSDLFKRYARVVETGEPHDYELLYQSDGIDGWFRNMAIKIGDGIAVCFTDITRRRKTEEALRDSEERAELLSRTISALLTAVDPQDVVEQLCNEVRQFLHCAVFFNYLLDPHTGRLKFNACGGVDQRLARLVDDLELSGSLCGTAAQGRCRVHAENLGSSDDPRSELVRSLGIRAYACHPLLGPANEAIGTLSFGATDRDSFRSDDLELMKTVADHVAVAMLRRNAEKELKRLNEILEQRVAERTAELREKDRLLMIQGRQAAMGEMIGNIAHQWRQPLNSLGLKVQQLGLYYDLGKINGDFLHAHIDTSMEILLHMSKTIDDFRNFFKPDKEKTDFKVGDVVKNALSLLGDSLKSRNIGVDLDATHDVIMHGYQNEFSQALLNILNNAGDAFEERDTENPALVITTGEAGGKAVVTVRDNAGGIPAAIINKIFDPYFSTKGPQQGTGLGLFMAKTIIEKNMGGSLSVRNTLNGAEFRIEV